MSTNLAIKIVTTANRSHQYFQTQAAAVTRMLNSLRHGQPIFERPSLIIVNHNHTDIFNPRQICYLEIETNAAPADWLPHAWQPHLRRLGEDELAMPDGVDDGAVHTRVDLAFSGGAVLHTWLDSNGNDNPIERKARLVQLFEHPFVTYQTAAPGIGLINPAAVIRTRIGLPLHDLPTDAWQADAA